MEAGDNLDKLLSPEEELLWSGSPDAMKSSGDWFCTIWLGIVFIFSGLAFMNHLLPGANLRFQFVPEMSVQIFGVFYITLGIFTMLFFPIHFYLNARDQIYAVTNQRLLWISRKAKKIVLVCTPQNINSISVIQEDAQYGSLHFLLQGTENLSILLGAEIHFEHVRDAQALSDLIASTFKKTISLSESDSSWLAYTYQAYRASIRNVYWPARDQTVSIAVIKSVAIWTVLMILALIYVGTAPQTWLSVGLLVLCAMAATHGLVLFLTTLRRG